MQIGLGLWLGTRQVGGFSPATLFAAGEQGGWYDPSDLSTMFQDSAGTTPVTATGQTVGLLLDKSQGLVLGPELRGTGNTNIVGVAIAATYNTSTGAGSVSRVDASNQSYVEFTGLTNGLTYQIMISCNTGAISVRSGLYGASVIATLTTGQSITLYVPAASNNITVTNAPVAGTATFTLSAIKLLAGNHLTQATAASRPIYGIEPFGGRRNLLTWTEQFDNAAWSKSATGTGTIPVVTADVAVAPDGTMTADQIVFNKGVGTTINDQSNIRVSVSTTQVTTHSVWLRASSPVTLVMRNPLNNGTYSQVDVTTTWQRFTITFPTPPASATVFEFGLRASVGAVVPDTATVFAWGAQLEVGSLAKPYQRVTDQWNVTEAGVPSVSYVQYDGTDDWFISPTITPGINKAQVFAGVRKLSDAAAGALIESSASTANNPGVVGIFAPGGAAANYSYRSQGSAVGNISTTPSTFTSPITNVLTGIGDIAGDNAILRVNGVQAATSATDQGTGNYLAYPLYVGRRGGTSLPFNGRLYQLLVRFGANLDASTIAATETFVNSKTGAYV